MILLDTHAWLWWVANAPDLPESLRMVIGGSREPVVVASVSLTPKIAARSASLPDIHRDPIDRVLVATAIDLDAVLATKDAVIRTYPGVRVLWDR